MATPRSETVLPAGLPGAFDKTVPQTRQQTIMWGLPRPTARRSAKGGTAAGSGTIVDTCQRLRDRDRIIPPPSP
jgi:hypothetical protein